MGRRGLLKVIPTLLLSLLPQDGLCRQEMGTGARIGHPTLTVLTPATPLAPRALRALREELPSEDRSIFLVFSFLCFFPLVRCAFDFTSWVDSCP